MAPAAIGAGASILSGLAGGKGASRAAKTQAKAYQQGLAQQQQQFNQTRSDNLPFLMLGQSAVDPLQALYGLGGQGAQQSAYDSLRASPTFQTPYGIGVDTILQNGAATGGLRGGNIQNSLANFGAGLFNDVLQQRLSGLGGLVGIGQGTGNSLGSLGQANSNAQSQLYGQIGGARATQAAAPYSAFQSTLGGLNQVFGAGSGFKW